MKLFDYSGIIKLSFVVKLCKQGGEGAPTTENKVLLGPSTATDVIIGARKSGHSTE